jgi:hypothetical protein
MTNVHRTPVSPPVTAATAAPPPPTGGAAGAAPAEDDKRKRRLAAAREGRHFQLPMVGQLALTGVLDHYYDLWINPKIRNTTEKALGHTVDKPFTPRETPGFVARELAYGIGTTYLDNGVMALLLKRSGHAAGNMLTSAGGAVGANVSASAGVMTAEAAAAAMRGMIGRTFVMSAFGAAIDALWGAKIGDTVEHGVNRLFRVKEEKPKEQSGELASNVPLSTVKQTREQTVRAFARSFTAATSYTVLWKLVGSRVAKMVFLRMGGPVGAIASAFSGVLVNTLCNHVVVGSIAAPICDAAQGATRVVEKTLGLKVDEKTPKDVVAKIGDRVSIAAHSAMIPFLVAALSGNMRGYMKSLAPD